MNGGLVPEFWDDAATVESAKDIVVGESTDVPGKDAQLTKGASIAGGSPGRAALRSPA